MSLRVVGSTSRRPHRDFQTDYRAGTARSTLPDVQNLFVIGMRLARTSTVRARSTRSCPRPHLRQSPVLLAADFGILHQHPLQQARQLIDRRFLYQAKSGLIENGLKSGPGGDPKLSTGLLGNDDLVFRRNGDAGHSGKSKVVSDRFHKGIASASHASLGGIRRLARGNKSSQQRMKTCGAEVGIRGRCLADAETLHAGEAGAIGERELLVLVAQHPFPSLRK